MRFEQYLKAYEKRWQIDPQRPVKLKEYPNRTLYTTWDISYSHLQKYDPAAAELLKMLACFDNQSIWYDLLNAGVTNESPAWLTRATADIASFESIMRVLVEYCFVNVQRTMQTFSMHNCVHDWLLAKINKPDNTKSYWYAFGCVKNSFERDDWRNLGHLSFAALAAHAVRLAHVRLHAEFAFMTERQIWAIENIAELLQMQVQYDAAEFLLNVALKWRETDLGPNHGSTLSVVHNLGGLYADQGKPQVAEAMYKRALIGHEQTLGLCHIRTLTTVNSLGHLYMDQGKLESAEAMYDRALAGEEQILGPSHISTLETVNNLGSVYAEQGKLKVAEAMYERALSGMKQALGNDHAYVLSMVNNLGDLYRKQGKMEAAEAMFIKALSGLEQALGHDHPTTLRTVRNLGDLYQDLGKLEASEQLYARALDGLRTRLGPNHPYTKTVFDVLRRSEERKISSTPPGASTS